MERRWNILRPLAQQQSRVFQPLLAATLNNLGIAPRELRQYKEAENYYREAIEIYNRADVPDRLAQALENLARSQMTMGTSIGAFSSSGCKKAEQKSMYLRIQ